MEIDDDAKRICHLGYGTQWVMDRVIVDWDDVVSYCSLAIYRDHNPGKWKGLASPESIYKNILSAQILEKL